LNQLLKRRIRKKMNSGLNNSTKVLYGVVSTATNAIEYKTENDNRAKKLNDAYWKSTAGYDAIFAEQVHSLRANEIQTTPPLVSGSLKMSLKSTFDVNDNKMLLPSIVNYVFPGDYGQNNENPAAVLTITEWLIHDVIRPLSGGFMNPWLYPTVQISDVSNLGVYTVTFSMSGPLSDKAKLEEAIRNTLLSHLASRSVSYLAGTVADVFATIDPNTDLALISPVTIVPTLWTKAIWFPNVSSDDRYLVDATSTTVAGPLTRLINATDRPNASGKTSPTSQPWAVTTVFKYTNDATPLTLFAQSSTPLTSVFGAGIWLELLGNQLNLTVGQQGIAVYLRYTDISETTLKKNSWIGLCLTWNGHQSDSNPTTQDLRAAYQLTFVDLSTSQISKPSWTEIQFVNHGGGVQSHAFGTGTSHYVGAGHSSATADHNGFRGLIASHLATTLLPDTMLPSDAEVALMVRNPTQWLQSYKAGEAWRKPLEAAPAGTTFVVNSTDPLHGGIGTKIWLMGDGVNDTVSNIYNRACSSTSEKLLTSGFVSGDIADINDFPVPGYSWSPDDFTDLFVVPLDFTTQWDPNGAGNTSGWEHILGRQPSPLPTDVAEGLIKIVDSGGGDVVTVNLGPLSAGQGIQIEMHINDALGADPYYLCYIDIPNGPRLATLVYYPVSTTLQVNWLTSYTVSGHKFRTNLPVYGVVL
jgi:hypothetical protein